jgi:hypothetical protein
LYICRSLFSDFRRHDETPELVAPRTLGGHDTYLRIIADQRRQYRTIHRLGSARDI